MVLMRFKVLINLVRKKVKKTTIRKERKNPIKPGNLLQMYASEFIGLSTVVKTEKKALGYLTELDARLDGFDNLDECRKFFLKQYKCDLSEEFVVITYDPHYESTVIVPEKKIDELYGIIGNLSFTPEVDFLESVVEILRKVEELKTY